MPIPENPTSRPSSLRDDPWTTQVGQATPPRRSGYGGRPPAPWCPVSDELTVQRLTYAPHVKALDALVGLAFRLGLPHGDLDPDAVLAGARRATGLDDFGGDAFLEPMGIVAHNARRLAFTNLARVFVRNSWQKAATNRLLLQDLLRRAPQIRDVKVDRPIFVLGFPRTGTTLLQNLLACDPGCRGLKFYELITPIPVSEDPETDRRRRLRSADLALNAGYLVAPEMGQMHAIGPETFEECWYLFMNTFCVMNWDLMTGLSDYGDWLLQHDMRAAYHEYRTWLQVLLHVQPADRLLLKCPEHLWFLDALLDAFPDACIVWTHRDPVASIASYGSMMSLPRRMIYGKFEPLDVGRMVQDRFHAAVTRAMAVRDRVGDDRFLDVHFHELVAEPKAVAHRVFERFDLPVTPDLDARMDAWLAEEREDERGAHKYSAARYGIDPDDVMAQFADYIARYDIPTKRPRRDA